jgi:polyphosphate kinase
MVRSKKNNAHNPHRYSFPRKPERFFNRQLSWLQFNWRVLHEAGDDRTPLLERLKFIAITGSNLDEFFMKRVGGLKRQIDAGVQPLSIDGQTPKDQLTAIRQETVRMIQVQRDCFMKQLLPRLKENGVLLLKYEDLDSRDREHVRAVFEASIFPVLTPLAVDPGHPFPFLSNLSLSLGIRMREPEEETTHFARVKIPDNVPRWVPLSRPNQWIPVEEVIAHNIDQLFPSMKVLEVQPLRVTRNADIERDEEEADDLLDMIEEELRHRRFAAVVRLEVAEEMSDELRLLLAEGLEVAEEDIYPVPGPLRLADLMELKPEDLEEHRFRPAVGTTHPVLKKLEDPERDNESDIFQILKENDVLVHHPYHSFSTSVLRFLETAANDPKVLAIKQTLYRTAKNSPIIAALIKAASNGKQVAVLVEIKARFDEANNIEWVRVLENAGVHVSYGLVGLKTHTKTLLVVREESEGLRCYCHIGTGNYHTGTARLYTDFGLLTSNEEISKDIVHLFNYLTGRSHFQDYNKLLVAPTNMRRRFLEMISRETAHKTSGRPARIIAKMNQLEDRYIIDALYEASCAGVPVDLIIRGFCCLKPGVKGLSGNIRVLSTIGRFLEHSRIFYFHNDGQEEYYIGSADWMYRNLDTRVECATVVEHPRLQAQLKSVLEAHLNDYRQTWELLSDGTYRQRKPRCPEEATGVQARLLQEIAKKHM